ncbi:MAG: autotransporter-associated beta strand repeat-containing protein [Marinilabiliaceae bacterium]|nr:autotransporter-associated beta strand repeat-containing protein [Marinilabiliaceae bacterium]
MRKVYFFILFFSVLTLSLRAQRKMETLDRGLVAVKTSSGVFTSWRIQGYEWYNVTYNVYRNGNKLNSDPLNVSNYLDAEGTTDDKYSVSVMVNGLVQDLSEEVNVLLQNYLEIPMKTRPDGYEINDATAADLDGDGEYEIIVKRVYPDWSAEATLFTYFEAYKLDGTFLWEINVGPNIMSSSAVEINIACFDFDEDGKAEVFLRTSEGTIFGDSSKILDTDNDGKTNYRYAVTQSANMQYVTIGPEFLSLVNGETGEELDRVAFIPRYPGTNYPTADQYEAYWGDAYGHRSNKFFFGAPYLDGKHPSLFIGRGIYTRTMMRAYDVINKKLVLRWDFNTDNYPTYAGQGNHNYTIADVDMDGRDEIVWGSMTVDDNGKGLYSTRMGHGDALHVGDLDPYRKGIEVWKCLENSPMYGTVLYDGATGEILIHDVLGRDCGRSCAANISDDFKGKELWGSNNVYSATTKEPVITATGAVNYRIYWDGDLLEEVLDHNWNGSGGEGSIRKPNIGEIFLANGTNSCNWTKGTPCLQADLFGDWREEVIWRTADDSKIRIYTTTHSTIYRNYSLMHDHQYRQAICWQMCGYNQPPHVSYFLGKAEGILLPPPPTITNERLVYNGDSVWNKTSTAWLKNDTALAYSDGEHVHFDVLNGNNVSISLSDSVSPSNLTVNSPGNYTLNVLDGGKLSGEMNLIKQGVGAFNLNGLHDFKGITEIWAGRLNLNGNFNASPVWINLFGEFELNGEVAKGVVMRYGSRLFVGGENKSGVATIDDSLYVEENGVLEFDLFAPSDIRNDSIVVNGNLILENGSVVKIMPHLFDGEERLAPGQYVLASVSGNIVCDTSSVLIEGILGTPAYLSVQNGKLLMVVKQMRNAGTVYWNGSVSNEWDLVNTPNFLFESVDDVFVTGDDVVMNDDAITKNVIVKEMVSPALLTVNSTYNYLISGDGAISGSAELTKQGSGKLTILNTNSFTGKVLVAEGILEVSSMPNSLDGNGAIGSVSDVASLFEINGGTLSVTSNTSSDRALYIGSNGCTISNNLSLKWNSKISGGELTKIGSGELVFASKNTNSKLILKGGAVRLYNEDASPGSNVTFEGGTLYCYDNSGTWSTANYSLYVGDGKTGAIYADGRCDYKGSLTGSGILNIYIPYVRTEFGGNWSNFEGSVNLLNSNAFRVENTYGYSKTKFNLATGASIENTINSTVKIGTILGTGVLYGSGTWEIGGRNESFIFRGDIISGNVVKVGTGVMTLSAASSTSGTVNVNQGGLMVINTTGSATGSGVVYVNDGAFLGGMGTIAGSVFVQNGGMLKAGYEVEGYNYTGTSLKVKSVTMNSGSVFYVKTNTIMSKSDKLVASSSFVANGQLVMSQSTTTAYSVGQTYQIVSAPAISGAFSSISPETPGEGMAWDLSEFKTSGIVKVVAATAIDYSNIERVSLYPNPTTDYAYVNLSAGLGEVTIQVETINGSVIKILESSDVSKVKLSLGEFEKGIYLVRIIFDDKTMIGKIVLK